MMLTAINISIQLNWASRCKNRTCGLNVYISKNSESIKNSWVYNQAMESLFITTILLQTTHTHTHTHCYKHHPGNINKISQHVNTLFRASCSIIIDFKAVINSSSHAMERFCNREQPSRHNTHCYKHYCPDELRILQGLDKK